MRKHAVLWVTAVAVGATGVIGVGSAATAKRPIKPKGGGYVGKVTNSNGKGTVRLVYATFDFGVHAKPIKGLQLFQWNGVLKCGDGSTRDGSGSVFAPLRGIKFSGKSKTSTQTVSLKGKFTASTKIVGTVTLTTASGPPPAVNCRTGPVRFKAHRVNH